MSGEGAGCYSDQVSEDNPRAKMLFRSVNEPTPALLTQRMNEAPSDGLGEYLVAGIKSLCGHDPQGS